MYVQGKCSCSLWVEIHLKFCSKNNIKKGPSKLFCAPLPSMVLAVGLKDLKRPKSGVKMLQNPHQSISIKARQKDCCS